jgi:hypothetical protein
MGRGHGAHTSFHILHPMTQKDVIYVLSLLHLFNFIIFLASVHYADL